MGSALVLFCASSGLIPGYTGARSSAAAAVSPSPAPTLAGLSPDAARGTLSVKPPSSLLGTSITASAGFSGTWTATLDFGDGTTQALAAPTTVNHTYLHPGKYALTLADPTGAILARATEVVGTETVLLRVVPALNYFGRATNVTVILQTPVGVNPTPVSVVFGDGSGAFQVSESGTYSHVYPNGRYTAVVSASGSALATAVSDVELMGQFGPLGDIASAEVTQSPVRAGDDTTVQIIYAIETPPGTFVGKTIVLRAVIELFDGGGNIADKSDPFTLTCPTLGAGSLQTATIPYLTPADASGLYAARVSLLSADGKIIAMSDVMGLQILAGPTPTPSPF